MVLTNLVENKVFETKTEIGHPWWAYQTATSADRYHGQRYTFPSNHHNASFRHYSDPRTFLLF